MTFIISNSRVFRLPTSPDALVPRVTDTDGCYILKPNHPAVCPPPATVGARARGSYVGVYPPLPYLLPALATRLMSTKHSALSAARLANGFTCLALLATALLALQHRAAAALSVSGVAVALWPNAMFLAWGLNPNGLEIISALAFYACLLRLARKAEPPRSAWYGAAITGFVLCASRPTSPIFMVYGLLMLVLITGPRALRALVAANRRRAAGTGAALLLGALSTALWDHAMHAHVQPDFRPVSSLIGPALQQLPDQLRSSFAALGWGEVRPPESLYTVWFAVLAGLWLLALAVGTWRQRLACLVMPAAFVVVEVVFFVLTHPSGFPMGGRYVQAALTALPLLWIEVLLLNRERLSNAVTQVLVRGLLTVVLATQLDLLFVNGRRWAVGRDGPATYLFGGAVWSPPGGWLLWAVITLVGCLTLLICVELDLVATARRRRRPGTRIKPPTEGRRLEPV